ncbi:MAG: hypothetical protein JNM31_06880 [Flavobacteriales bacterium]|nr:hypothetical protein [Flavobacteriales bacterium]
MPTKLLPFALALLLPGLSIAQNNTPATSGAVPMTFAGTHPPDGAVLALLAAESEVWKSIAQWP